MSKALNCIVICLLLPLVFRAQVLYQESFSTYALSTYTSSTDNFQYSAIPAVFSEIRDNYRNDTSIYNKPFNIPGFKYEGWALYKNLTVQNDTFLVGTSWLDTSTATSTAVNRWFITPPISNIAANSIVTWLARSPDSDNRDGYEVYATTNTTGTLTTADFSSSNLLFSLPDLTNGGTGEEIVWTKRGASLAAFAGQTVRIAFRAMSVDKFQLWLDDIMVKNVPLAYDVACTGAEYDKYVATNTATTLSVTVQNNGYNAIGTLTIGYKVGTNPMVYQFYSPSPALYPNSSQLLTLGTPVILQNPQYNSLKIFVIDVNGTADQDHSNDTTSSFITASASALNKKVLVKMLTGTSYGWGPEAQVSSLDVSADTNSIFIAIHENDNMATPEGTQIITDIAPSSVPTGVVDGIHWDDLYSTCVDRNSWATRVATAKLKSAPVDITILNKNYNSATRVVTFDVKYTFAAPLIGSYSVNAYLTENNVCGPFNDNTINNWNQLSYSHDIPNSPYFNEGAYNDGVSYILSPFDFMHHDVMLSALDGPSGNTSLIPGNVSVGQSITASYTYTLPLPALNGNIYNADNIYITAALSEGTTNMNQQLVLNANRSKLLSGAEVVPVGINELKQENEFTLFPVPADTRVNVKCHSISSVPARLSIVNHLGEDVFSGTFAEGSGTMSVDVSLYPPGVYMAVITKGNAKTVHKFTVTH